MRVSSSSEVRTSTSLQTTFATLSIFRVPSVVSLRHRKGIAPSITQAWVEYQPSINQVSARYEECCRKSDTTGNTIRGVTRADPQRMQPLKCIYFIYAGASSSCLKLSFSHFIECMTMCHPLLQVQCILCK